MTNFTELLDFLLVTKPFTYYDVENVTCNVAVHLKRPCEDSSTKRVQNFTLSTVTTWIENGILACFKVMLTCCSVMHLFMQNQS
jgi:hypothetical protein